MSPREQVLEPPRAWLTWLLSYGVQRQSLRLAARRGDLIARLSTDPELVADPFAGYEELRARGTFASNGLVRATVDHAACNEILRSDDFGTAAGHAELPPVLRGLLGRLQDPDSLGPVDPPSMLVVDPPEHTRYRKQVARAFTARKVGRMADRVESVAERLLDDLADSGRAGGGDPVDLVDRYAAQLPVAVIADLLGVPEDERDQVLAWGNEAAVTLDPDLSWRRYRQADRALREMHRWFHGHVQRLRRDPGEDLLSQVILADGDGDDPLTDTELHQVGLLVLGAGFETTVNLIGNGVAQLDAHPDQLRWLQQHPDGWGNAVEEVLRYDSPVQLTLRAAHRDVEVAGVPIAAGDGILTMLGGANRDPAVFADAQSFDVTRSNAADHVAFSAGAHYCLGASLARLEATVALRQLYERFPDLSVAGRPERRDTRVLRGYEHLPVATGARAAA
ncbi:cytochrome P450 [Nocardioides panacisoli]|uniref:cytochrome P450 n=1 Tax=Nocardioides panacisoli TaxID=627624 RepID=UPI001C62E5DC|nr:cytochrome P450 [Nocardioides panacisoli]QYJ03206.1 cytochrome P450 [Nocardioides panacisoli]